MSAYHPKRSLKEGPINMYLVVAAYAAIASRIRSSSQSTPGSSLPARRNAVTSIENVTNGGLSTCRPRTSPASLQTSSFRVRINVARGSVLSFGDLALQLGMTPAGDHTVAVPVYGFGDKTAGQRTKAAERDIELSTLQCFQRSLRCGNGSPLD